MGKNIVVTILTISVVCTLVITGCKDKQVDTKTSNSNENKTNRKNYKYD